MADIGGQDIDNVIDALLLLIRAHQGAAEEGMPEVMDTGERIVAPPPPDCGSERRSIADVIRGA